jgi:hypothetical protein
MEKICFIYKIFCPNGDIGDVYIGSTTNQRINDRFTGHKVHYRNWKEGKKTHMTSFILFEKYGVENCVIEVLEQFAYDKDKIKERERYHIDINLCINIQMPGRSKKQYTIDNKEHLKIKALENKIKNWDAIKARKKIYQETHKEQYKTYCIANAEKFKKPIECECGSVVVTRNYCTHIKTKKHQNYLATINNIDNIQNDIPNSEEQST